MMLASFLISAYDSASSYLEGIYASGICNVSFDLAMSKLLICACAGAGLGCMMPATTCWKEFAA